MDYNSLERIIPEFLEKGESTGLKTLKIHIERYEFAGQNIKKGKILDIACGVGYGSTILLKENANEIEQIIGVDISKEAIEYANKKYKNEKTVFVKKNAFQYTSENQFDTIISLETIEHLQSPQKFIYHLKSLLKDDGIIIASVPTSPTMDANPHHLSDFTVNSFKKMFINAGMEEVKSFTQIQNYSLKKILLKQEKRASNIRKNILPYYLSKPSAFFARIKNTLKFGFAIQYTTTVFKNIDE